MGEVSLFLAKWYEKKGEHGHFKPLYPNLNSLYVVLGAPLFLGGGEVYHFAGELTVRPWEITTFYWRKVVFPARYLAGLRNLEVGIGWSMFFLLAPCSVTLSMWNSWHELYDFVLTRATSGLLLEVSTYHVGLTVSLFVSLRQHIPGGKNNKNYGRYWRWDGIFKIEGFSPKAIPSLGSKPFFYTWCSAQKTTGQGA